VAKPDDSALREVESQLLSRWGETRIEPDRERITALLDVLGNPHRAYRTIHVAGTNGKTSTSRMIDGLIQGFGLRSGRYTSPHLQSITERIVVDGDAVTPEQFVSAYRDIEPYLAMIDDRFPVKLSFYEAVTALGFAIFADTPVDVATIEVGMGGTWDATNLIDSTVTVITPIGIDHTQYLGDTIELIAGEKAGIMHAGATAILAAQPAAAAAVLLRRAVEVGAAIAREGLEFGVLDRRIAVGGQVLTIQGLGGTYDDIFLPLHGAYQAQNAALALAGVEAFFGADATSGPIDLDVVRASFDQVSSPGRLETVRSSPTVLIDASHNPHGMAATVEALGDSFDFRALVVVLAVLEGKDSEAMLEILEPVADHIVITQNSSSRAMVADDLAIAAVAIFGVDRVVVEPRLDNAIETAVRLAEDETGEVLSGAGVLITGSVVTAGEARTLLGPRQ
jgi:dihydrofolate synthase/folylpolyglutamate synthase